MRVGKRQRTEAKETLSEELKRYGYVFSKKKTLISLLFVFILTFLLGRFFSLNLISNIILTIFTIILLPFFYKNSAESEYVQQRFSDVNTYMEQFLYSFEKTGKILDTLKDTEQLFSKGTMKKKISMAIHHIENSYESISEKAALQIIEREYELDGIEKIHNFALNVEKEGGEYRKNSGILLEDRRMWTNRIFEYLKQKRTLKTKVTLSILFTLLLCSMIYLLGNKMNIDISKNNFVQIGTTFVICMDILIYYLSDKKMAKADFMEKPKKYDLAVKKQKYWLSVKRGAKKVKFKSISKFKFNLDKKVISKQIEKDFPKWLLSLSLLLQNYNVQVAIEKSYDTAPLIIKPHIIELTEKLRTNPVGIEPYLSFMSEYTLPDVKTAMKALYSLSENGNGSSGDEIKELLERNHTMMHKAFRLENEDRLSGFLILFFMPQITGGIKLIVDMMALFGTYLSNFSVLKG